MKCGEIYKAMIEAANEVAPLYVAPNVSKRERDILALTANHFQIFKMLSTHAKRRAFRRFKKYSLAELMQDFIDSKFLHSCCDVKRSKMMGKLVGFIVNDKGVIISIIPKKPRAVNKQKRFYGSKTKSDKSRQR